MFEVQLVGLALLVLFFGAIASGKQRTSDRYSGSCAELFRFSKND